MPISSLSRGGPGSASPRHLVLRRPHAFAAAGIVASLAVWSAGSAWFILARDDIAQRVFVRDTETRYAYEDRIKHLEDDLRREVTRNLVEKDGMAGRIDRLALRQAEIEEQQARLARLRDAGVVATGSVAGPAPRAAPVSPPAAAAPFALRLGRDETTPAAPASNAEPPRDRISAIERSLDSLAVAQLAAVGRLRAELDTRAAGLRTAASAAGLDLDRLAGIPRAGIGGPLVPLPSGTVPPTGAFGTLAAALESAAADYSRVLGAARRLPLGRPLGELEQTSPFGYRYDPFTRAPALHTGVDLRAETGTIVRATASGRVTAAEWSGGYGNMVEIDHGNGLSTRYGHLSAYLVSPGETVEAGQAVARVGSTGRSTGSHLHYETRVNGDPVDPNRFLQASRLAAAAMSAAE